MSYLIDIREMLKSKSRVFIFISKNGQGTTTKIDEAGTWEEPELTKLMKDTDYAHCSETNLKYLEKKDKTIVFNRLSRKYFQVGK